MNVHACTPTKMLSKSEKSLINSLKDRKTRLSEQLYLAEGSRLVLDLLASVPDQVYKLIASPDWIQRNSRVLKSISGPIVELSTIQLQSVSTLKTTTEVVALMKWPDFKHLHQYKEPYLLYLDRISDPGNLGTIIRTADWFGLYRIYCSPDSVDVFNNKCVQASMSGVSRVEVIQKTWIELIELHPGILKYAAVLDGDPYTQFKKENLQLICIGNEANGLSEEIIKSCDYKISIPKSIDSKSESLNAAIAASILMSWKNV
ncbi:MAG: RNA methyltransferase [Saprospiraceae bacterium]|nr:RNA methyltransferase [Saprospiraceae bacterium]MBK7736698.1 RNA methyltransferase [Saprospiraceae bacterium]